MHLLKFVYIKCTYIPNVIPNSKIIRNTSPKVIKGHQRSIGVFSKNYIHKTYVYNNLHLNWSIDKDKNNQRLPKDTKGQFLHLVKFVYIKFTYIPNFIPNSKKLRKASPKVTKGHQRSIGVFSKHCIHKI